MRCHLPKLAIASVQRDIHACLHWLGCPSCQKQSASVSIWLWAKSSSRFMYFGIGQISLLDWCYTMRDRSMCNHRFKLAAMILSPALTQSPRRNHNQDRIDFSLTSMMFPIAASKSLCASPRCVIVTKEIISLPSDPLRSFQRMLYPFADSRTCVWWK